MQISRRELVRLAGAALPASALAAAAGKVDSRIQGVMIGAQTYSFRDRSLDAALEAMQSIGLGYAELWDGHVGPKEEAAQKEWRTQFPVEELKDVRRRFDRAGIELYAYTYGFREDMSDAEIEGVLRQAQALGVRYMTSSGNVTTARRVDPIAGRYRIRVGMHNHSNIRKNEFATPEDFSEAMKGMKNIAINLDIGHFTAAGFDPVAFIAQHHADIITLHIKDRKKNQGDNMPFGEGDTPITGVMKLLKAKHYKIPAMIEYEYEGKDTVEEVRRCFDYLKQQLA